MTIEYTVHKQAGVRDVTYTVSGNYGRLMASIIKRQGGLSVGHKPQLGITVNSIKEEGSAA